MTTSCTQSASQILSHYTSASLPDFFSIVKANDLDTGRPTMARHLMGIYCIQIGNYVRN